MSKLWKNEVWRRFFDSEKKEAEKAVKRLEAVKTWIERVVEHQRLEFNLSEFEIDEGIERRIKLALDPSKTVYVLVEVRSKEAGGQIAIDVITRTGLIAVPEEGHEAFYIRRFESTVAENEASESLFSESQGGFADVLVEESEGFTETRFNESEVSLSHSPVDSITEEERREILLLARSVTTLDGLEFLRGEAEALIERFEKKTEE